MGIDVDANDGKIAIVGATGRLGREVVNNLSSKGIRSRCLIRSEDPPYFLASLPNVEFVKGDVTNLECVNKLLEGCSSCLALHGATRKSKLTDILPWVNPELDPAHPKNINYLGVRNIIEAARATKDCKRIVRITGKGETPWSIFSILINMFGSFAKAWNYEGEEVLRKCQDVDYTIIRPGVMKNVKPDKGKKILALADDGGNLKVSSVPYSTIADLCVQVLRYPNTARATLCAMNVPEGEGEVSYASFLQRVEPDRRIFPSSLMQQHVQAVRAGVFILLAAITSLVTGAVSILSWLFSKLR